MDAKPYETRGRPPKWWTHPCFKVAQKKFKGTGGLFRSEHEVLADDMRPPGEGGEAQDGEAQGEGGVEGVNDDGDDGVDEGEGVNVDAWDEEGAVGMIEAIEGMEHSAKTSAYMSVPGKGPVHKRTICAWEASGTEQVSGDRMNRAAQASSRACLDGGVAPSVFDINSDPWIAELGSEIAAVFEDAVWIGSILMIRRRYANGGWAEYTRPVDLEHAKKNGWELLFTCCWYKQVADGLYTFGVLDPEPVSLAMVACPVALEEVPSHGGERRYKLPEDQVPMVEEARANLVVDERPGKRRRR